ncbi:hypothetical protein [Draconibacterium halophilum]|uniref:Uncharacterized protein n=1 Tax=Draconibacterium halophilum TaxID=2706887 RepID=A0A6C0RDY8_9BACT|nr:hypothetical protein [Draconibacterium halophilum]QIA07351.1 hypothetical protein G0Q07_06250 [Draconibacterium halophilum]
MLKNNLCCRIYPLVIILVSALISATIFYFDEGAQEFSFLREKGAFFDFLGISLAIAVLPVALFYYLSEKEKFENSARPLSLLGFVPALIYLVFIML